MKAIKLTAIAAMLSLAFSCNKGKIKPVPIVNYEQTFRDPAKIIKTNAQNDKQSPLLQNPERENKGVWGDDQFPAFQNPEKINR